MPSLRAIRKEVGDTSIRAPTGRDEKRGEEAPSNVETGEGSFARTVRKRVCDVDDNRSWEGVAEGGCENWDGIPSYECLRIVLVAGSGLEVIKISFQP